MIMHVTVAAVDLESIPRLSGTCTAAAATKTKIKNKNKITHSAQLSSERNASLTGVLLRLPRKRKSENAANGNRMRDSHFAPSLVRSADIPPYLELIRKWLASRRR